MEGMAKCASWLTVRLGVRTLGSALLHANDTVKAKLH